MKCAKQVRFERLRRAEGIVPTEPADWKGENWFLTSSQPFRTHGQMDSDSSPLACIIGGIMNLNIIQ